MQARRRWRSVRVASGMVACVWAVSAALAQPAAPRRSGFDDLSPALQAMQRDDAQNPAMLWVADGQALWSAAPAGGAKACAGCHDDAAVSMRGVAARYPAIDARSGRVLTLAQRIDQCRTGHQQQLPWPPESQGLLGLQAFVALQSRGQPVAPAEGSAALAAAQARGEAIFKRPLGQLDLSCAACHDGLAGRRLAGNRIPQAHPNGYPTYRLEWQGLGSLARRLRNCLTGVRAEPFAFDAPELTDLEAYLALRAKGLPMEAPAVRP